MAGAASKVGRLDYQVTNWSKYNESLVCRGDITFWFSEEVVEGWEHPNDQRRSGHPFVYSDLAIQTLLMIRELFQLPYRQTEGLGRALVRLMNAGVQVPDYTSLQKRAAKLGVATTLAGVKGPVDVVVDSTGLKVFGDGEWKARQHGAGKRRTWRKLHLAVDPATHTILAHTLTESGTSDPSQVAPLLEQIDGEVKTFYADGAYDTWEVRDSLKDRQIDQIIPPRKSAKIRQHGNSSAEPLERDECVRQIRREGKQAWKESIGYHRRSLVETAMSRLKANFGDRLKNRSLPNQQTEAALRCTILNWFVTLGMPLFAWG